MENIVTISSFWVIVACNFSDSFLVQLSCPRVLVISCLDIMTKIFCMYGGRRKSHYQVQALMNNIVILQLMIITRKTQIGCVNIKVQLNTIY